MLTVKSLARLRVDVRNNCKTLVINVVLAWCSGGPSEIIMESPGEFYTDCNSSCKYFDGNKKFSKENKIPNE